MRIGPDWPVTFSTALITAAVALGCTSLGHENRAAPKISKQIDAITEIGFDPDDNELALALEKLLEARGVKARLLSAPEVREQRDDKEYIYKEVQTRYVLRVRSEDLDTCVPEGSRQMHFHISVIDYQERTRVLLMSGEYGCRDTLVKNFDKWLSTVVNPRSVPDRSRTESPNTGR